MGRTPAMIPVLRAKPKQCATQNVTNSSDYYKKEDWCEEEKLTLIGPDFMAFYWHDKRC